MLKEIARATFQGCRKNLIVIACALLLVALSHGVLLALVGPFFRVLLTSEPTLPVSSLPAFQWLGESSAELSRHAVSITTVGWVVAAAVVACGMGRSLGNYLFSYHQQIIAMDFAARLREYTFAAILRQEYLAITKRSSGEWMSRLVSDILWLQQRFNDIATTFIRDAIVVVAAIVTLFILHWQAGVAVLALGPLIALGMGHAGKRIAAFADQFQGRLADINGWLLGLRSRFEFVRAQGGESFEMQRFDQRNQMYFQAVLRSVPVRSAFAPVMEFLGFALFAAFIILLSPTTLRQPMTGEHLAQLFAAIGIMLRPLRNFGEQTAKFAEVRGVLRQTLSLLQQDAKVHKAASHPQEAHGARAGGRRFRQCIIRKMAASYGPGADIELREASIVAGQVIGVIGPSGSGKSLFLRSLAGLVSPCQWDASISYPEFAERTSLVGQFPFLFSDSIMNNLRYGNTAVDERLVAQYLESVGLSHDVDRMQDGLDTIIHPLERNLSGGQIQRLALVRALVRETPVLLLDEATASVDRGAEEHIIQDLLRRAKEKDLSVIMVTHRLEFLPLFDDVWFFENGRRIFHGKHAELMAQARYAAFCQ